MPCITTQRIGEYTYYYESTSFRDSNGRPRNSKVRIGKRDPKTGEAVYTQEYAARLAADPELPKIAGGRAPEGTPLQKRAAEVLDTVKSYGHYWFLREAAGKAGLLGPLKQAFPEKWKEVFTLACYLVVSDKPVMYCEDWLSESEWCDVGSMSSQRVSDLLAGFGERERNAFYRAWYRHVRENEYVALDITSVSSYSRQIDDCEWGHNRDGEKLPQVNICMLFGETSRLPVYQTSYSGSLGDVSTLECTASEFEALFGECGCSFVMDKGFFSTNNVNMLIKKEIGFLVSVPFTSNFAKMQVESERKGIDQVNNVVLTSGAPVRGVHKVRAWGSTGAKLHVHVYFDPERALKEKNGLFATIAELKGRAHAEGATGKHKAEIEKYLIVRGSKKSETGRTVSVREDAVAAALKASGWLVLVSDHIDSPQTALDVYRMKDVVEKGFWKYKNSLGLERLRVHSSERAQNKGFVAFVALILSSFVHNTMKDKRMYEHMTFDKLFLTLAKMKSANIDGKRILRPLTKQQKDLIKAFDMKAPVG